MNYKCCQQALCIPTHYAGKGEATHPNVIAFERPWNGYMYYMGFTPFPHANGSDENPSVVASNDLINWEIPDGLHNPIANCLETNCDELKDSHLLYNCDANQLELWYLGRVNSSLAENSPLSLFRKVSSDGVHWTDYENLYCFNNFKLVSPSIIYQDGKYHLWGIRNDEYEIALYKMTSNDAKGWSTLQKCNCHQFVDTGMWHGAIMFDCGIYHFVWVGINCKYSRNPANNQKIHYAISSDGLNFTYQSEIIRNDSGWYHLYRPSLLINNRKYYLFYGVVRYDNKWLIGLSEGKTVSNLNGYDDNTSLTNTGLISTSLGIKVAFVLKRVEKFVVSKENFLFIVVTILSFFEVGVIFSLFASILLLGVKQMFKSKNILFNTVDMMILLYKSIFITMEGFFIYGGLIELFDTLYYLFLK